MNQLPDTSAVRLSSRYVVVAKSYSRRQFVGRDERCEPIDAIVAAAAAAADAGGHQIALRCRRMRQRQSNLHSDN